MPETYRALMCEAHHKDVYEGIDAMKLVNMPYRAPGPKEVRVEVHSTSLNFPELLVLQNRYQVKPKLPFVLCSEAAGVVVEVGSAVDPKQAKVGQRVMFQSMFPGTCSEQWIGDAGLLVPLPDELTYSEGAAFLMGFTTGYHGLVHRGKLQKGEWLLVTGAGGGMGICAVQLGHALGARVIAAASSDDKLELARKAGAQYTINYSREKLKDAVGKITNNEMCDVIYDPVGGDIFDQCLRCVATAGYARLLVVGFAAGRIPQIPANLPLIKGFSVVGVRSGHQLGLQPTLKEEMMVHLLELARQGLKPIVAKEYALDDAKDAFRLMADRRVVAKVCITLGKKAKL